MYNVYHNYFAQVSCISCTFVHRLLGVCEQDQINVFIVMMLMYKKYTFTVNNLAAWLHTPFLGSSSGSLPTRQVQMFDVAIPLVVELVLSAFYILPPSSSLASFVLASS